MLKYMLKFSKKVSPLLLDSVDCTGDGRTPIFVLVYFLQEERHLDGYTWACTSKIIFFELSNFFGCFLSFHQYNTPPEKNYFCSSSTPLKLN